MKINFGNILLNTVLIIWIGIGAIIVIGHFQSCRSISLGYLKLMSINSEQASALEECRKYNPFQAATSKIGKRPYSEEYDYLDHTKDLQKELAKVDIASSIFINKNRDHSWLGVWIEAVNGQFIGSDNDLEILEVRNSDMQTVCHK